MEMECAHRLFWSKLYLLSHTFSSLCMLTYVTHYICTMQLSWRKIDWKEHSFLCLPQCQVTVSVMVCCQSFPQQADSCVLGVHIPSLLFHIHCKYTAIFCAEICWTKTWQSRNFIDVSNRLCRSSSGQVSPTNLSTSLTEALCLSTTM